MSYHTLAFKTQTFMFSSHLRHQNHTHIILASSSSSPSTSLASSSSSSYKVRFDTLDGCKLGIARYPDFEYNARGGGGRGEGKVVNVKQGDGVDEFNEEVILVEFDVEGLFIPPLSYETTKFLGLPLPPFLKIEIVPEVFQGRIEKLSGKVDLEFKAKFWFSIGTIYKAPPLLVVAILTSEESTGEIRNGGGQRLDNAGRCRLVGVATVDPIDDLFMNTFLGLPTECLADMNAAISLDQSA